MVEKAERRQRGGRERGGDERAYTRQEPTRATSRL
jgi:hypothetical protein